MEKITKFDLGTYFKVPNPGLLAYFDHVKKGQDVDIRPPFWEGKTREQVLELWDTRFDSLHVDHLMPGLKAFELEMRGKVGPLSLMLPLSERIDSIEEYYKAVTLPAEPIDRQAIDSFCRTLRPVKAQQRSFRRTMENMRLNTNSGAPEFTKRNKVLHETMELLVKFMAEYSTPVREDGQPIIPYELLDLPAVLGWRGQEGGPDPDDVKQRVVWMFPFGMNVAELSVYQPLVELWQHYNINSAYVSMRAVEEKITRLFATKGDEYVVVTDFSKFDQHFNKYLQSAAKDIISYQLHNGEKWLEHIFPVKFNIPLICSKDLMYTGSHGMGSGSGGTNFDECCSHGAMQHEVAIRNDAILNPYSNAYGDDGYLSFKGIDVDKVISSYTSHGQVMNPDKQWVDKHSMVYLRRYFHDSYRDQYGIMLGVYSTYRALGRLLGQERFIPFEEGTKEYARYLILRAYSILENCANSPIFEQFVDFVISGDKYRLGLSLPGFLDSLDSHVQEIVEKDPGLLGYTKTLQKDDFRGINSWKVVQYLKSKA